LREIEKAVNRALAKFVDWKDANGTADMEQFISESSVSPEVARRLSEHLARDQAIESATQDIPTLPISESSVWENIPLGKILGYTARQDRFRESNRVRTAGTVSV